MSGQPDESQQCFLHTRHVDPAAIGEFRTIGRAMAILRHWLPCNPGSQEALHISNSDVWPPIRTLTRVSTEMDMHYTCQVAMSSKCALLLHIVSSNMEEGSWSLSVTGCMAMQQSLSRCTISNMSGHGTLLLCPIDTLVHRLVEQNQGH